jgi:peptidyl-prolyl cis-trans isomerase D
MIKGVLWLVVAAFVGTIFLVWGRGGDVSKTDMAAIVNDRVISLSQYYNEYQNLEQVYREIYGNLIDKNVIDSNTLKREALENLINRELFSEAAEKLDIKVSDDEVQRAIATTPAFAPDGQFDRERYLSILRKNGIAPKDFEEQMKRDLRLKKLQRFIQSTVMISEKEILDRYATINREIRLNYVSLDPASMKVPPPKSEDIQLYYADSSKTLR